MESVLRRSPLPLRSVLDAPYWGAGPEPAGETVSSQSDDGEGVLKIPAGEAQRDFLVLPGHGPQEPRFCGGEIFADKNPG